MHTEFWKKEFLNSGVSIDDEIDDIEGTISNERLWLNGCCDDDECVMIMQNIEDHVEYLNWLYKQKESSGE